ncbi:anaerobic ribonucleoside-triphosphate reductase activating protein [Lachnospiraceae bacterium LCP25S3_G4]
MRIQGIQKLTLLDYPGQVACTVFTAGCNFRCPFCHNASLVTHIEEEPIEVSSIFRLLAKRQGILDGVCISGGEPLLQPDIETFMERIKALGYKVKLDTNGSDPDKLQYLVKQKLVDYVAMDIKNSIERYASTIGVLGYDMAPIKRSVEYLLSNKIPYEFRTTVVQSLHDPKEFEEIGSWVEGASAYYIQAFVDSGDVIAKGLKPCNAKDMHMMKRILEKYVKNVKIRGI